MVNLTASVGRNGVNRKDDVVVVQALLNFTMGTTPGWGNIPYPNGTLCGRTIELIAKYQRRIRRKSSTMRIDARVDPFKEKSMSGQALRYSIVALNTDAFAQYLLGRRIGSSYIHTVGALYPEFKKAISGRGVGSLGLELEGGVGSLGLELEGGGVGSLGLGLE